jgi:hypothetical protein
VAHTTYDVRIKLPDASEKWIPHMPSLRKLSQIRVMTDFAGVKFCGYSGVARFDVGCFASALVMGYPPPSVFCNQ